MVTDQANVKRFVVRRSLSMVVDGHGMKFRRNELKDLTQTLTYQKENIYNFYNKIVIFTGVLFRERCIIRQFYASKFRK